MRTTIVAAFILLVGSLGVIPSTTGSEDCSVGCGLPPKADCAPHGVIRITEDEGPRGFILDRTPSGDPIYRPGSGVVAGNGTAQDPYVIAGWCLRPTENTVQAGLPQAALTIRDTTAHVLIQDNVIDGTLTPAVIPGQPPSTTHDSDVPGIRLTNADHVDVVDNRVVDVEIAALVADEVHGLLLANNTLSGAAVFDSTNVRVADNRLAENPARQSKLKWGTDEGLLIQDTDRAVVVNNQVIDNEDDGVIFVRSDDVLAANNTIVDNEGGLLVRDSADPVIRNNTFSEQGTNNIRLDRTTGGLVANNELHGPASGMFLFRANGARIVNNTILNNGADPGGPTGIELSASSGNVIRGNTLAGHDAQALLLWRGFSGESSNNLIVENEITDNPVGIRFGQGDGNVVRQNNIHDNRDAGLVVREGADVGTVDARNNWWGCPGGPSEPGCDDVVGDALVDPWLASPNPDAGAG